MKTTPFRWDEEVPAGTVSQSPVSFTTDSSQCVLNIRITQFNSRLLREMISYILGYSRIVPEFDSESPSAQGPYTLRRYPPARHPRWPAMFAKRILSITGKGTNARLGVGGGDIRENVINGVIGNWAQCYMSILFELPEYRVLDDGQMQQAPYDTATPRPEYHRYCIFSYDTNFETLARKGVTWYFWGSSQTFPGDRLLRVPKGVLKIKWLDVPEQFVMWGNLIPNNLLKCIGKLNSRGFPKSNPADTFSPFRDQNAALGLFAGFPAGTLLMQPPKIIPKAQVNVKVLDPDIPRERVLAVNFLQRTVDVEMSFLHFDPPTTDGAKVDLSAVGGDANTPVRGHNLMPKPTTNTWHVGVLNAVGPGPVITGGDPRTQNDLLYQYENYETMFEYVRSS